MLEYVAVLLDFQCSNNCNLCFQMSQNGGDSDKDILTKEELVEAETLLKHGINKTVAKELLAIYQTGKRCLSIAFCFCVFPCLVFSYVDPRFVVV